MENIILDENPEFIKIGSQNALKYEVRNNGKNIGKISSFNQWLEKMKKERGDNGIICYCVKCKLFFYFQNLRQKHLFNHEDCQYSDLAEFCEYCGELYIDKSICCFRKMLNLIKKEVYKIFQLDCQDYCFMLPIISIMYYFSLSFHLIGSTRITKKNNINYNNKTQNKGLICFGFSTSFVYSLVFLIPFIILYFVLLIISIFTRKQVKKDFQEHIIRY